MSHRPTDSCCIRPIWLRYKPESASRQHLVLRTRERYAGYYFYQWKTGIFGALSDVKFVMNDEVLGSINTGEWLYFEVPAGPHEYVWNGGIIPQSTEMEFHEGSNYFFRGFLSTGSDTVSYVDDEQEINETIENIKSGRYERGNAD